MNQYPLNWPEISFAAKLRANFTCKCCCEVFDPWHLLSLHTHHIDMDKANCVDSNLKVLCKPCHYEWHYRNDPIWDPQPEFDNWEIHKVRTPVHIREVIKDVFPRFLKIQRVSLNEVKP